MELTQAHVTILLRRRFKSLVLFFPRFQSQFAFFQLSGKSKEHNYSFITVDTIPFVTPSALRVLNVKGSMKMDWKRSPSDMYFNENYWAGITGNRTIPAVSFICEIQLFQFHKNYKIHIFLIYYFGFFTPVPIVRVLVLCNNKRTEKAPEHLWNWVVITGDNQWFFI